MLAPAIQKAYNEIIPVAIHVAHRQPRAERVHSADCFVLPSPAAWKPSIRVGSDVLSHDLAGITCRTISSSSFAVTYSSFHPIGR